MSFLCHFCKKTSNPGEKMRLLPTETRQKVYPGDYVGSEIVKEAQCCECCWRDGVSVSPGEMNVGYMVSSPEFLASPRFPIIHGLKRIR